MAITILAMLVYGVLIIGMLLLGIYGHTRGRWFAFSFFILMAFVFGCSLTYWLFISEGASIGSLIFDGTQFWLGLTLSILFALNKLQPKLRDKGAKTWSIRW